VEEVVGTKDEEVVEEVVGTKVVEDDMYPVLVLDFVISV
jgi:hypothetical protein